MAEKTEQERSVKEKLNHQQVGYQYHSSHPGERCSNCSMYIQAALPRCTLVVRPIWASGWCDRWQPKQRRERNQWP
jgi:hypothetical protein